MTGKGKFVTQWYIFNMVALKVDFVCLFGICLHARVKDHHVIEILEKFKPKFDTNLELV